MNTTSESKCCDPRSAGVALGRWVFAIMFLFAGCGKFRMGLGVFADYMAGEFKTTFLPAGLVTPYAYALPFVEVLLGIFLLIGFFRFATLLVSGLLMISLAFGTMQLQKADIVFANTSYVFMIGALLFLGEYDTWLICPRSRKKALEAKETIE